MPSPIQGLARNAKRSQFRLIEAPQTRKQPRGRAAPGSKEKRLGARGPARSIAHAADAPRHILLYRRVFADVAQLVAENDVSDRDTFFYCMKWMALLGLRTEDVITHLRFTPETIARWVNGSRCPHPQLRQYVLETCLAVLAEHVEQDPPQEFVRLKG